MNVRVLSDGKPGHRNQSLGLARDFAEKSEGKVEVIELSGGLISRIRQACQISDTAPGVVISAGRKTHIPLLFAKNRLGAKAVVIMRPQLPLGLFDAAILPRHDGVPESEKVILTRGPLNTIAAATSEKKNLGVILIGGLSKHFGWDSQTVADACCEIVKARPELDWIMTDSRRTPADFPADQIPATFHPHQETEADWLAKTLAPAKVVWVTPDSASMVYEALTAGAAVGLLPLPDARDTRVSRGIQELIDEGMVSSYPGNPSVFSEAAFHEASRCADTLLKRWKI